MSHSRLHTSALSTLLLVGLAGHTVGCTCRPPRPPEAWCDSDAYRARLEPLLPPSGDLSSIRQACVIQLRPEFPKNAQPNDEAIGFVPARVVALTPRQVALLVALLNDPFHFDCANATQCYGPPGFVLSVVASEAVYNVELSESLRHVYSDSDHSYEESRVIDDTARLALLFFLDGVLEDPCFPSLPLNLNSCE